MWRPPIAFRRAREKALRRQEEELQKKGSTESEGSGGNSRGRAWVLLVHCRTVPAALSIQRTESSFGLARRMKIFYGRCGGLTYASSFCHRRWSRFRRCLS